MPPKPPAKRTTTGLTNLAAQTSRLSLAERPSTPSRQPPRESTSPEDSSSSSESTREELSPPEEVTFPSEPLEVHDYEETIPGGYIEAWDDGTIHDEEMSTGPTFKVREPDTFSGDPSKYKTFITQLELHFVIQRRHFTDESGKVLFAACYLQGRVQQWFQTFLAEQLDDSKPNKSTKTRAIFADYSTFKTELRSFCGVQNEEEEAKRKLFDLKQLGSVANYASQFQALTTFCNWDEDFLKDKFYRGLKYDIREKYILRPRPNTLQELIDDAKLLDHRLTELRLEMGTRVPATPHKANQAKKKQPYYGPEPMDLDANQKKPRPRGQGIYKQQPKGKKEFKKYGKLSQEERDRRIKEKLCLYCGKPGHQANECRAKNSQMDAVQPKEKQKAKRTEENQDTKESIAVMSIATMETNAEPEITWDQGKATYLACTETHVHLSTYYWRYGACKDEFCVRWGFDHSHVVYDPQGIKQGASRMVRLPICQKKDCPLSSEEKEGHVHIHQGGNVFKNPAITMIRDEPEEPSLAVMDVSEVENEDDNDPQRRVQQWVEQENQAVREIIQHCVGRGALVPKYDEKVHARYLSRMFQCRKEQCAMRAIPHVHLQHYDPEYPYIPMTQQEARGFWAAQGCLTCQRRKCPCEDKHHIHIQPRVIYTDAEPKNDQAEEGTTDPTPSTPVQGPQ